MLMRLFHTIRRIVFFGGLFGAEKQEPPRSGF